MWEEISREAVRKFPGLYFCVLLSTLLGTWLGVHRAVGWTMARFRDWALWRLAILATVVAGLTAVAGALAGLVAAAYTLLLLAGGPHRIPSAALLAPPVAAVLASLVGSTVCGRILAGCRRRPPLGSVKEVPR